MNDKDLFLVETIDDIDLEDIVKSYPNYVWLESQAAHSRYKHLPNVKNTDIRNCSATKISKDIQKILFEKIEPIVYEYAKKNKISFFSSEYQLVKYTEGQFFIEHTDSTEEFPRKISALLYLNEDYSGGEIVFSQLNISIKPTKNMLVVFPSSSNFSHSAEPVISGTKYVIVGFWS